MTRLVVEKTILHVGELSGQHRQVLNLRNPCGSAPVCLDDESLKLTEVGSFLGACVQFGLMLDHGKVARQVCHGAQGGDLVELFKAREMALGKSQRSPWREKRQLIESVSALAGQCLRPLHRVAFGTGPDSADDFRCGSRKPFETQPSGRERGGWGIDGEAQVASKLTQ